MIKTWHINFQEKYEYQGPTETFEEFAEHLRLACQDLVNETGNLIDQYGDVSDLHVNSDDCDMMGNFFPVYGLIIVESIIVAVGLEDEPCLRL